MPHINAWCGFLGAWLLFNAVALCVASTCVRAHHRGGLPTTDGPVADGPPTD